MLNLTLVAPFGLPASQPLQPIRQRAATPQQASGLPTDVFSHSPLASSAPVAFGTVATAEAIRPAKHPDVPDHVHTMAFAQDGGKNAAYFASSESGSSMLSCC